MYEFEHLLRGQSHHPLPIHSGTIAYHHHRKRDVGVIEKRRFHHRVNGTPVVERPRFDDRVCGQQYGARHGYRPKHPVRFLFR